MARFDLSPKQTNALWFFVALLGGAIGISCIKIVVASAWLAAAVAAGVVLTLAIYYIRNDEDAPEEEGDNVYYLGLLFTLISLMFTLLELFGVDVDKVGNAEQIPDLLENFGIALISTIVGIAGRVMVQNWQRTGVATESEFPDSQSLMALPENANIQDLKEFNRYTLGRIARDLTQGANALARFHRIVRRYASDSQVYLSNHSKTLKQESAAFEDTLQRDTETFVQELKSRAEVTLDVVGDRLDATVKRAEVLLDRLQSAHDDHLAEVRKTTKSFHDEIQSASGQSLDAIRQNFDAVAKQSLSLMQNVSTTHERIGEASERLGSGLGQASDASVAFGNSAHQAAKSTKALELEADKLRAVLATVHAGAEAMTNMLDAMGELDKRIRTDRDTEQTAVAVQKIGETLRVIADQGAAAIERGVKAAELFDALTQSVRMTEDETRRATEALRALANEAEMRTKTLRERRGLSFRFWKWRR